MILPRDVMKALGALLVLLALLAAGAYLWNARTDEALAAARDSTARMTALWEDAREGRDSTAQANDVLRDSLGVVTDSLERTRVELAAERREAAEGTAAAGDSLEETLTELEGAVREELRPVVRTAQRQQADQRAAMSEERRVFEREMENMAELLATVRDSATTLADDLAAEARRADRAEDALAAAQKEITTLRRKVNPPFLVDLWRNAEKVGAGAAAALIVREALASD